MREFILDDSVVMTNISTKRMMALIQLMEPCKTIADIGCDHGKLCKLIMDEQLATKIIASDISEESLKKAKKLFENMEPKPDFRVGNGLNILDQSEAQGIVIAGMGGRLISSILEEGKAHIDHADWILCQPMQQAQDLRRYLRENHLAIAEERIVFEEERYFEILKIVPRKSNPYPEQIDVALCDEIGPRLWEDNSIVLRNKIRWTCEILRKKLSTMQGNQTERAKKGRDELEKQLQIREDLLKDLEIRAEKNHSSRE